MTEVSSSSSLVFLLSAAFPNLLKRYFLEAVFKVFPFFLWCKIDPSEPNFFGGTETGRALEVLTCRCFRLPLRRLRLAVETLAFLSWFTVKMNPALWSPKYTLKKGWSRSHISRLNTSWNRRCSKWSGLSILIPSRRSFSIGLRSKLSSILLRVAVKLS